MTRCAVTERLEQTFEEGRKQGCVESMDLILRAAFSGTSYRVDLARKLAENDLEGNIRRVIAGATLDELQADD